MRRALIAFVMLSMVVATACAQELLSQLMRPQKSRSHRVSSTDSNIDGNGDPDWRSCLA